MAKFEKGQRVILNGILYCDETIKTGLCRCKSYYIYDGIEINGRYRVTSLEYRVGRLPMNVNVSGWAQLDDLRPEQNKLDGKLDDKEK